MHETHSQAALALENARLHQEARRAVRERDELLAIVAHDLRHSVNAVVMLTGAILSRGATDPAASGAPIMTRDEVESIRAAARQADGLIQDLQDVSRMAVGRLQIEHERFSAFDLLTEAAEIFEPVMVDAALRFLRRFDEGLPSLHGDRQRLLQVLSNLLGNAVRFTPYGGEVVLSATVVDERLRVEVRDSGPGIAPDEVPRLFEPYGQAPRLLRAGSGLGLSLCKGIIEAHGGEIGVTSAMGTGSAFWFIIP